MKKSILFLCSLLVGAFFFVSCSSSSDDEPNVPELEKKYFTISNASFQSGAFPTATIENKIQGLSINKQALTGGMNFITILSEQSYKKFFVGVRNVDGYYAYVPTSQSAHTGGYYSYTIPVMYSTEYGSNITMLISGEETDGDITEPYEAMINYVDSESGDLNINLTFSNAKDVDLHLYTPENEHIYYNNRGGSVETTEGKTVSYGLDHDSNASCTIDNLNNENIYLPAEKIMNGTYKVVVDMYSNCDRTIPTSWAVIVRYKGNIISAASGSNPATGVYAVGAGNGDMTQVMTFTITDGISNRSNAPRIIPETYKPFPVSDLARMKYEESFFDSKYQR